MNFQLQPGFQVLATVSPVKLDGSASTAKLSALTFTSSNPAFFTAIPEPSTAPNAVLVTGIAAGTGLLTATATATESDGRTESITGTVTIDIASAAGPPATSLVFSFGSPNPVTPGPTPVP